MDARALLRWGYDRSWHRWPVMLVPMVLQFRRRNGRWPNLLRPRRLNEKTLARMLFDRRALLPRLAGKLESRAFVRERLGSEAALVPLLGVVRTPADLRAIDLPPAFVMKGSHGSGMIHVQRAGSAIDLGQLERLCAEWLGNDYGKYSREWIYRDVERAVVIEALMLDAAGRVPVDYKIYCYDGVPRVIHHVAGRFEGRTQELFTPDWALIDHALAYPRTVPPPPRPPHLPELLAMAATLSRGLDFVRVDLYDLVDGPRFGEMTLTPDGAHMPFPDPALDVLLGEPWRRVGR